MTDGAPNRSDISGSDPQGQADVEITITKIFVYRHLLNNLESTRQEIRKQEQVRAPRIKGPRVAALLARLWANEDLELPATPQKIISRDLGLSDSEASSILGSLAQEVNGESFVELIANNSRREKLYKITNAGKRELYEWVLAQYTHGSFPQLVKSLIPNHENRIRSLEWLQNEIRHSLGI
jgi:DNA-binding MarR family transcriptional regulator